jgi:hypothetical protein
LHTAHYIVAVGDVLTYDGGVFENIVAIISKIIFDINTSKRSKIVKKII